MSTPYPRFEPEIVYPHCDGKPVAESDFQLEPLLYSIDALKTHFQERQDVYVAGDMFFYYVEGDPKQVVAPDVFVVFGVDKHKRFSYKLWQEGKAPAFILEITSKSTQAEDQGAKRGTYAYLGVKEYWLFDATGDYLNPSLQGNRLVGDSYQTITDSKIAHGGMLTLYSEALGLELCSKEGVLRFYDPVAKQYLLSYAEAEQARQQAEQAQQQAEQARLNAEQRATDEAAARSAAEARIAELEAQLQKLQSSQK